MKRHILPILLIMLLFIAGCSITPEEGYIGSINSDKYHYQDCEWAKKIKAENEILFANTEEAEKAGYRPCKTCRP